MPNLGDQLPPGAPAPAAGTYQCSAQGCTSSFVASLAGAPLPGAHHAGATWRLVAMPGTCCSTPKPAMATGVSAAPAPTSSARGRTSRKKGTTTAGGAGTGA